ncbi:hypothetical protein OYT1_ch2704 [Ferriphaselus amnicola]|uniref:Replication initiation factor n=1 Tax=Ferriphaselus amnicola TaxID=1188319 RepID=A0A2Z6GF27_9PROT|nr:hypothetical protein [Ferriphaselus amnicola]BBE52211.1 hypothetical protein OYT1_ch2704 [Ferriphaselus amnicola]
MKQKTQGFTGAAEAAFPKFGTDGRASDRRDGFRECGEVANTPVHTSQAVEGGAAPKGTPPSNTVPVNYNPLTFQSLRYGVDSLYLSYPGILSEEWDAKLSELKELAKSEIESEQALAQVVIGEHIFEVKDRGRGKFAYVLADNCYHLQASNKNSKSMPMAYVQISSGYLASVGVEQAEKSLSFIVKTLGLVKEPANISRVDLFVDFVAELRMDSFTPLEDWVTRTESIDLHYRHNQFSGWSFGMGGDVGARLYNKCLEVEHKSHAYYLHDLWREAGWDGSSKVWRMEFEAKREVLKQLGICKLNDLLQLKNALWVYLTEDWLRLAVPSITDTNQTRWPTHPLWSQISSVFVIEADQPRVVRFNPARMPDDHRLFVHGMGSLTSFMASRGITDVWEAAGEYLGEALEYHKRKGGDLYPYVDGKVKLKNRKFNSTKNQVNLEGSAHRLQEEVEALNSAKSDKNGDA